MARVLMIQQQKPLVVIVGPTASGKTGLAVDLARLYDGEIISADSRAVYRGLDIGTAKPLEADRGGIPHWGIDLVNPGERFTAADFQLYALAKIGEVRARGHTPFIVGGTGLYVDAILYSYDFPAEGNHLAQRSSLMMKTIDELIEYCINNNIDLPNNHKNKRHVVSAIMRNGSMPKRSSKPLDNCIIVGIATENEVLKDRIRQRARQMFAGGVIDEALSVARKYGWDNEAMTGNIYPVIHQYAAGMLNMTEAIDRFVTLDWRLAKRQLTWLRRGKHIHWLCLEEAYSYIEHLLAQTRES